MKLKKNKMTERGITLIALVITIIVMLILVAVMINIVAKGKLFNYARDAKEETEMAKIKEEAEMIKSGLDMQKYEENIEVTKESLLSALQEYFKDSTISGNRVTVYGKYDIIINDDLIIKVVKHGQKVENIQIAYKISDIDENTKVVNLSFEGLGPSAEELESIYERLVSESEGEEFKIDDEFRSYVTAEAERTGYKYVDYLSMVLQSIGVDLEIPDSFATVTANGEAVDVKTPQFVNPAVNTSDKYFFAKRSGTYIIEIETDQGDYGRKEITVDGIENEKFSEIYTTTKEYVDSYGNKAMIPAGFAVGTSSDINTIEKGLVITDGVDSNGFSKGNEFVWIPVSNINGDGSNKIKKSNNTEEEIILGRYGFDENTGEEECLLSGEYYEFTDFAIVNDYKHYYELTEHRESNYLRNKSDGQATNTTAINLASFINSVQTYGGYYIARYEASYGSSYDLSKNIDNIGTANFVTDQKPLSKFSTKGTAFLPWEGQEAETLCFNYGVLWNGVAQGDAAKACKNMYLGNQYVVSDLTNSYAWDTAIVFIQKMGNNSYSNKNDGKHKLDNSGTTGDLVCNIYDLSGNCMEMTTEYCNYSNVQDYYPATLRGGSYHYDEPKTSTRSCLPAALGERFTSFRPILYVI